MALAFPSLAKAILDEQVKKLVLPQLKLAGKDTVGKETESGVPVKEGGLLQQDIRLFLGKKTKLQGKEAPHSKEA